MGGTLIRYYVTPKKVSAPTERAKDRVGRQPGQEERRLQWKGSRGEEGETGRRGEVIQSSTEADGVQMGTNGASTRHSIHWFSCCSCPSYRRLTQQLNKECKIYLAYSTACRQLSTSSAG